MMGFLFLIMVNLMLRVGNGVRMLENIIILLVWNVSYGCKESLIVMFVVLDFFLNEILFENL